MNAISKWKIATLILPIAVFIGVGIVSKSWSPQIISGEGASIPLNSSGSNQVPEKWHYLFPPDSVVSKIIDQQIFNDVSMVKPFDQNERMLSFLAKKENKHLFSKPLMGVFDIDNAVAAISKTEIIFSNENKKTLLTFNCYLNHIPIFKQNSYLMNFILSLIY